MDNKQKKLVRRGFSAIGIFLFFFSLLTFAGLELPYYNHWNPLYNPYYYILIGFIFHAARFYIKDKKGVYNMIDFFGRSGLVNASFEIPFENISPTHANYVDKEGEKKSIRHSHPMAIPSTDSWTNEYLVPSTGLEALNPTKLVQKYGAKLKDETITVTEMSEANELDKDGKPILDKEGKQKTIWVAMENSMKITKGILIGVLLNLQAWIPEIQALDPNVLHDDMAESDNVDGLNMEAAHQTSEIRKGWFTGTKTGQVIMYVAIGLLVGSMATLMTMLAGHVDFAHINGMISQP